MTHSLSCLPLRGGYLIFASTEANAEGKHSLIRTLLRSLARLDPAWRELPFDEVVLHKSPLGKPHLFLKEEPGPPLSLSHGKGRLWAAICTRGVVGIDVAFPDEFTGGYPFARAFRPEELDWIRSLYHKDPSLGAALLWSIKEASVKASGTGFHLQDPLEVCVGPPRSTARGFHFEVVTDRAISVWARTEGKGWLSLASADQVSGNSRSGLPTLSGLAS